MADEIIRARLEAQDKATAVFKKHAKNVDRNMKKVESRMDAATKKIQKYAKGFAALGAVHVGKDLLNAFFEQEKAVAQLRFQIVELGHGTEAMFKSMLNQASQLQSQGIFGDEVTIQVQQMALGLGLTFEEVKRLMPALHDLSAKFDFDLLKTFKKVTMALGTSRTALQRYGITLDKNIDLHQNLDEIVTQVEKRFKGAAASVAQTSAGMTQQATMAFGDLQEAWGQTIVELKIPEALRWTVETLKAFTREDMIEGPRKYKKELEEALTKHASASQKTLSVMREETAELEAQLAALKEKAQIQEDAARKREMQLEKESMLKKFGDLMGPGGGAPAALSPGEHGIVSPVNIEAMSAAYERNAATAQMVIEKELIRNEAMLVQLDIIGELRTARTQYMHEGLEQAFQWIEVEERQLELAEQMRKAKDAQTEAYVNNAFELAKAGARAIGANEKVTRAISLIQAAYCTAKGVEKVAEREYGTALQFFTAAALHATTAGSGRSAGYTAHGMGTNSSEQRTSSWNPYNTPDDQGSQQVVVNVNLSPEDWDGYVSDRATKTVTAQINRGGPVRNAIENNLREM